jgi:cellulose synthase/poly-beta-1,6-N-acetylglucosamine synthase-like glycosyltransferase
MIRLVFHVISIAIVLTYVVILALSRHGSREDDRPTGKINVVVPTYNEAGEIDQCLESLIAAGHGVEGYSVNVVDDNSPDGTAEVVARRVPPVNLIRRPGRVSKADALNHAVGNLEGDFFAVVDADCVVGEDWLRGITSPLGDQQAGVSTGSILVRNREDSVWSRMQSCELAFVCHQLMRPVERVGMLYSINGNNFAFTRACWERVGGFDSEKLTEDTNFAIRTRLAGLQIHFAGAKAFTRVPSRLGDLLRQRRRWYLGWYQDLSRGSLLVGALFILLFYYAPVFFLLSFSFLTPVLLLIYYLELLITYRGAYGRLNPVNPLVFIVLAPLVTTTTILTALPSALRGGKRLTIQEHW